MEGTMIDIFGLFQLAEYELIIPGVFGFIFGALLLHSANAYYDKPQFLGDSPWRWLIASQVFSLPIMFCLGMLIAMIPVIPLIVVLTKWHPLPRFNYYSIWWKRAAWAYVAAITVLIAIRIRQAALL